MRVLLMHNEHNSHGGATEVMDDEADILAAAGHDVEKFLLPSAESQNLSGARAALKAVWNREAAQDVQRLIVSFRPDVAHVHTPFPLLSPAVFRVAAANGVPAVTTLHSYRYSCVVGTCYRNGSVCEDCVGSRLKLAGVRHRCYHDSLAGSGALTASLGLHRAIGTFRNAVTRFITLTAFSKRLLVRDGIAEEQVRIKANSVPDPGGAIDAQDESPYVAFAGRLVDVKGVQALLDAWRHAPSGLSLRIAGDGPMRGLVEERAAQDPSIQFLGWLAQDEVTDLLGRARCTVLPSQWYEGQPLVTLRSLSVGTPMIVSDLENLSEDVVADGAGVAFATGDAASLAGVLATVIDQSRAWRERGVAARRSYEQRHTPAATLSALETIYAEASAEVSRR